MASSFSSIISVSAPEEESEGFDETSAAGLDKSFLSMEFSDVEEEPDWQPAKIKIKTSKNNA
jgi:hypothetical protein